MENSKLIQISKNVYYLPCGENDRPILGIIIGDNATALVDAGNSPEHAKLLLAEIKKMSIEVPPIKYIFITHWHWDHIFGLSMFQDGVEIIAHKLTVEKISEMVDYKWDDESLARRVSEGLEIPFGEENIKLEYPDSNREINLIIPNHSFQEKQVIDLGGVNCVLEHVGCDHSLDSTIITVDEVTFIGDSLYPNLYSQEEVTEKLISLLEKLLNLNSKIYIESHDQHMSKQSLNEIYELFKIIFEKVKSLSQIEDIIAVLDASSRIEELMGSLSWERDDLIYYVNSFFKGLK